MEKNLENIAVELFGKLRTQFPSIKLRDKDEDPTDIPKFARFFEFNYVKNNIDLGTITISIDDNPNEESDGLVVMYSQDIVANQPEMVKHQWFKFLESLSDFASRNVIDYNVRDITKSNLDQRQQSYLANNRGDGIMSESKKLWGTSRTSFQEMGEAKLIVKHSKPVNYNIPAGRAMHIESIFVENTEGERFRYPFKHLNGARALAMHVAHGGNSYDSIGQYIIRLSEELAKLRMFKGYVDRNEMVSEAMGNIHGKVLERINQVKKEIHNLQNRSYYESFADSFTETDAIEIPEDIVNDWVDRLTVRSFNEELKNVFPYIYKLVGEQSLPIKELTPADLINDNNTQDPMNEIKSEIKELTDFESYMHELAMTEAEEDDPPFEPDPPKKEKKSGDNAKHDGHSRAKHLAKAAMEKAKKAGAKKETVINIDGNDITLGEAATMIGLDPDEFFVEGKEQTEILEFVKSMFDENTGQFPKGVEGVKIAVEKEFGEEAGQIAERVIAELGQVFESNRIKKLAGLI
jgi:hypothetical protein